MENERVIFNIPFSKINIEERMTVDRASIGTYRQHHLHTEAELVKVVSGEINAVTDRGILSVASGESVFINGGVMHHIVPKAAFSRCIMIQTVISDGWDQHGALLSLIAAHSPCGAQILGSETEVSRLIAEIAAEAGNKEKGYELFIKADIAKIAANLLRSGILPDYGNFIGSAGFKKIAPAIEYVDRRYAQKIRLQEVAETLNFDRFYFCKLFKSVCHVTLTDYINSVRLSEAEKLLRKGYSVTSTAYDTGFTCTQYFNRCFKNRYGCSPSTYKKYFSKTEQRLIC